MDAQLKTILPSGSWAGDAVALAQSMYKDPSQPWDVRRDCMKIVGYRAVLADRRKRHLRLELRTVLLFWFG